MEMLTILISMKVKDGESEVEGLNNAHRLTNEVVNEWIDLKMAQDMVNKKNDAMNLNQNWIVGERIRVKVKGME